MLEDGKWFQGVFQFESGVEEEQGDEDGDEMDELVMKEARIRHIARRHIGGHFPELDGQFDGQHEDEGELLMKAQKLALFKG